MNEKLPPDDHPVTRTEAEGATVDLPKGLGFFTTGQVLGDRYEILEMLGRGGMGEVWRAFDLKLRVEVGLKALRDDLFQSERRLELLRQEVRAAREVVSPNVCRIFDLIEIDGRELVSMEYVDGATLLGVLQERGPLELKEAQDIASQFLAGLEAIHKAGLVHRDVKPENIMLTRAGRVVVMDFGLARGPESGAGSVSGTPAYMAPEHAAGGDVDARADVYSAGVVLAEMVSPEGIKSYQSRQSVWEGVRSEPAKIPDSPWAPVIKRAVARDRERRQNSAHTLIRELEDVTLRVEGADDLHPYPGLASFTEEDAEYFFGREAEVEQMWRKLTGAPRMLGLVGPSGAGKSSFINAGVIPNAGAGWSIITCTPGSAAFRSLGRALASELAGDADAMRELVDLDDVDSTVSAVSRWRGRHSNAALVVDQFEELFTLNASDVQTRFTELLGRIVIESDVFVLLSMRDDFFFNCHQFEALNPIVTDLTLLGPPTGGALRRALVQPATKCGYRFEDDALVDEMLAEVEGERGALPLLAFALARLWEKRDRETGLLTRQAYQDIGGVGGALARHAEATVDRIGVERIPIVRELFRNLVTAEGTRAVREWGELLSVFEGAEVRKLESKKVRKSALTSVAREEVRRSALPSVASKTLGVRRPIPHSERSERSLSNSEQSERSLLTSTSERSLSYPSPARAAAADVLRELIDARLLTSYEVREDEHDPIRRVEIIHESLLANWPRLVRWQTQDQEGAQLRDELRQSARAWDEHGRHDDRLWTGTAYREFQLWRERYPGGLTEVEDAFATAMTSYSTRRRRRRRLAAAAVLVVALAVSAVTTTMWRKSVVSERRAEAQKLIAMGQLRLEDYPTSALAHAAASLELTDTDAARLLALEALWRGPPAFVANDRSSFDARFSPSGEWLVQGNEFSSSMTIIRRDGSQRVVDAPSDTGTTRIGAYFQNSQDLFVSAGSATDAGQFALWSAREGRLLAATRRRDPLVYGPDQIAITTGDQESRALFATTDAAGEVVAVDALYADGRHESVGQIQLQIPVAQGSRLCMAPALPRLALVDGREVSVVNVGHDLSSRRHLGRRMAGAPSHGCRFHPSGRFFLTVQESGEIQVWDATGVEPPRTLVAPPNTMVRFSADGSHLLGLVFPAERGEDGEILIWEVDGFDFHLLRRVENAKLDFSSFDPVGARLAMRGPLPAHRLWNLGAPAGSDPMILGVGPEGYVHEPSFSPDGQWLTTNGTNGTKMWPLARRYPSVIRVEFKPWSRGMAFPADGSFLATSAGVETRLWPLEGRVPPAGEIVFQGSAGVDSVAVSPDGELFAVGSDGVSLGRRGEPPRHLGEGDWQISFSPHARLVAAADSAYDLSRAAFHVWEVSTGEEIAVLRVDGEEMRPGSSFTDDGRLLTGVTSGVVSWDVDTGKHELLIEFPLQQFVASEDGRRLLVTEKGTAQSPKGSPIFFDLDTGETTELTGHAGKVWAMAVNRDATIVATGDSDGIVRVGPLTAEEPHLLLGHDGEILCLAIDPKGRWIASGGMDGTLRLWPMPDLSKPPLHTLPREELIAKLKTLTNLRVVRDPESATGWKLTHDPFPGWETVPTW